jgi:serine protease Do
MVMRTVGLLSLALVALVAGALGFLAGGGGALSIPVPRSARAPSFADVVERLNAAVVHVDVIEAEGANPHDGVEDAPALDVPERSEGSGFIVDASGYILTNQHLVARPTKIRIRLADKRELKARVVGTDESTDLALLKVEADHLPTVPLGDSDHLRVGDWVCAIGNPLDFDHSVTVGVVSSKGRKIFNQSFDDYIQTDAAINPGNSGGPLINAVGEAIGISSAMSSEGQGIGFAIPINLAKDVLNQLRAHGRVSRGYLGIELHELDPDLSKLVGFPDGKGAVVLEVVKGGPGEAAGLRRYDVVTGVSGHEVRDGDELVRRISTSPPGSKVVLSVFRDGRSLSVPAQLLERGPDSDAAPGPKVPDHASQRGDALGLVVGEPGPRTRSQLAAKDKAGVVIKDVIGVDPGTDALDPGDVIVEINRQPTKDLVAYRRLLGALGPGQSAWLYVYRPKPASSFLTKIEVERP